LVLGVVALPGPSAGRPTRADFGLDARPTNATCTAPARPRSTSPVRVAPAFTTLHFDAPGYALHALGAETLWVVVQSAGPVRTVAEGDTASRTFAAVQADTYFEGGLLGMAFAPDWRTSRAFYLSYTAPSATAPAASGMRSVIARGTSANGLT